MLWHSLTPITLTVLIAVHRLSPRERGHLRDLGGGNWPLLCRWNLLPRHLFATAFVVTIAGTEGMLPLHQQLRVGATETAAALMASSTQVAPVTVVGVVLLQQTGLGT